MSRRRLWVAGVCLGSVVVAALVLLVWALPGTWRLLTHAPDEFWRLAVLAIIVDAPLYRVGGPSATRVRSSLSVCLAVAIFAKWGLAPALVVQAVAATASVLWQRYDAAAGLSFVARHVCALAVAAAAVLAAYPQSPLAAPISGAASSDVLPAYVVAAAWLGASATLVLAVSASVYGRGPRPTLVAAGEDLLIVTAGLLLVEPLLTTITDWWMILVALPLFAWNLVGRVRHANEQRLNLEPTMGVRNRVGLIAAVDELALYDFLRPHALSPFGVVLVDLVAMRAINHAVGREVYTVIAQIIAKRTVDAYGERLVGVLPGELGVVLVPGLTETSAPGTADAVVRLVEVPVEVDGIDYNVEPIVGVALSPEHGRDLTTLLSKAEIAVFEARRLGHPSMVYRQQGTDPTVKRRAILTELHRALHDPARADEITVLFQPQVAVATGRLCGLEALFRWTHPQWGPVPPDEIVEAVEPSTVMHALTRCVLGRVVDQLAAWNAAGSPTRVALNASVRDLHELDFADEIAQALRQRGVPPAQLTIEITERMVIGRERRVLDAAQRIAELGVGLSLDDFGTGFASIDQLRSLPLTEVKIDKSYVHKVAAGADEWRIVSSVHDIARTMHLELVAEGVEDRNTAAMLARLPGVIGQGWYFGHPMTAEALAAWSAPEVDDLGSPTALLDGPAGPVTRAPDGP